MSRYNLIDEPWIPVRDLNGRLADMGIKDVLLRSRQLASIEDPSPLVVAALHRFLLAALYRALKGPTDIEHAKRLFRDGFPADEIVDYLEHWRGRFFLFDEKYPFGQVPSVPANEKEHWTKLTAEYNSSSNKVIFDHTDSNSPGAIPLDATTRWLLATLNFSVSGGRGYRPSPSANAVICLPQGRCLQDTLLFALVPQNRAILDQDLPLWEREPRGLEYFKKGPMRAPCGYADLYTWQARAVLLHPTGDGHAVSHIAFIAGEGHEKALREPMAPFKVHKELGLLPLRLPNRGLWRNFDSLLPDAEGLAPQILDHAVRLSREDRNRFPRAVMVLGQKNDPPKATVEFWRMERFALPEALAANGQVREEIRQLLESAETAGDAIDSACFSYCRHILIRVEGDGGLGKQQKASIREMAGGLGISTRYWSVLERSFHQTLQDYASETQPDEIRAQWLHHVRTALVDAWNAHRTSVTSGDAWAIRALVKAEGQISRQITELDKNIRALEAVA